MRPPNAQCYDFGMDFLLLILTAGLGSVVLGHVWYHPRAFGRAWMRMTNVTPEMVERGRKYVYLFTALGFLAGALVAAIILGIAVELGSMLDGILLAIMLWIGCVVPVFLGALAWEQKPLRLVAINAGYWLLVFMMSGAIVAA